MEYLNIPYKNSSAYHACMNAKTPAQLLNRKRYTDMAIAFHKSEGNSEQVLFFESELALIEKRLKKLASDK